MREGDAPLEYGESGRREGELGEEEEWGKCELTDKAVEGKLKEEASAGSAGWAAERENRRTAADLDSECGLANATIAEDGYAPLVHDMWGVCWSSWEKTEGDGESGLRGQGGGSGRSMRRLARGSCRSARGHERGV
jgi:hypothetical protein